jgi:hypothetical protein
MMAAFLRRPQALHSRGFDARPEVRVLTADLERRDVGFAVADE